MLLDQFGRAVNPFSMPSWILDDAFIELRRRWGVLGAERRVMALRESCGETPPVVGKTVMVRLPQRYRPEGAA